MLIVFLLSELHGLYQKKMVAWLNPRMENNLSSPGNKNYKILFLTAWLWATACGLNSFNMWWSDDNTHLNSCVQSLQIRFLNPVNIRPVVCMQLAGIHWSRFRWWISFLAVVIATFNMPPVNLSYNRLISAVSSSLCSLNLFYIWCNSFLQLQCFSCQAYSMYVWAEFENTTFSFCT